MRPCQIQISRFRGFIVWHESAQRRRVASNHKAALFGIWNHQHVITPITSGQRLMNKVSTIRRSLAKGTGNENSGGEGGQKMKGRRAGGSVRANWFSCWMRLKFVRDFHTFFLTTEARCWEKRFRRRNPLLMRCNKRPGKEGRSVAVCTGILFLPMDSWCNLCFKETCRRFRRVA